MVEGEKTYKKTGPVKMLVDLFLGDKAKSQEKDKITLYKIVGVFVLGVILIAISKTFLGTNPKMTNKQQESKTVEVTSSKINNDLEDSTSYEAQMEKRLKNILKKMQGVGQVEVMITTTYGKEIILAEDVTSHTSVTSEEDNDGGTREMSSSDIQKKSVMQNGNVASGNAPVVIKEKQPEIQGALIIAQGAGNSLVKQSISEAAQTLLGIPAHRVTVHQLQISNK